MGGSRQGRRRDGQFRWRRPAFGVKNDGLPSGFVPIALLVLDQAVITDKVAAYTGEQFSEFVMEEGARDGHQVALLVVRGGRVPMAFRRPGTYDIGEGRQKTAFAQGTVYFRHGAKSEPGNSDDLRGFNREGTGTDS